MRMTNEEAIYCMMSYLPDDRIEHCINCPYYGCNKIDEQISICKSSEAHRMAIKAIEQTTWIPVNKKLPKPQEYGDKDYSEWVQITLHIGKDCDVVGRAFYCFSEKKWYTNELGIGEVTAWMPLPPSYQGE